MLYFVITGDKFSMMEWWYYVDEDREIGPVAKDEFQTLVDVGKIGPQTMVWKEGMESWQPYGGVGQFPSIISNGIACVECRNRFAPEDVIQFNGSYVCAACKPIFFQRIKEGVPIPGVRTFGTFWQRFWAKIIDGLLIWVVEVTVSLAWGLLIALMGTRQTYFGIIFTFALILIQLGVSLAYSVYFVGKFGATPGKMALGLRIIMADGSSLNYAMAVKRFFAELLSMFTMYIGYIMVAFDDERRSLHDRICDTRVIRK